MLSLLASVLSWNDLEREKAGLQHVNSSDTSTASSFWSRSSNVGSSAKAELDKSDETEVSLLIRFYTDVLTLPWIVFLSTLGRILTHRSICRWMAGGNHFYDKKQAVACSTSCILVRSLMRYVITFARDISLRFL